MPEYWFLNKTAYEPLLPSFALAEDDYLSALHEVTSLFKFDGSLQYYREKSSRTGGIGHFDLLPYPNQRLPYNPVPILLNVRGSGTLSQLLYLGLALRDFKNAMGRTKAFSDLISDDETRYRGALFEIEVGSELVRGGLKPTYRTTSPDFITKYPLLGIEATMREVPVPRAVAEGLTASLAFLTFKHLSVEILAKGRETIDDLVELITKDVNELLTAGARVLIRKDYRILHDVARSGDRTVAISWGDFRYEETLSHLIHTVLKKKEDKIRKGLIGKQKAKCVVALDARSLLELPLQPESEYERQMAERHQKYFDRLRVFQQDVIGACQTFAAQSPIVSGVLLWRRRRLRTPDFEVHRRYSISLVTPERCTELENGELSAQLARIATL